MQYTKPKINGKLNLTLINKYGVPMEFILFDALRAPDTVGMPNAPTELPGLSYSGLAAELIIGRPWTTWLFENDGTLQRVLTPGVVFASINNQKYPYSKTLEFLKSENIFITNCKLQSATPSLLKDKWRYFYNYPNGFGHSEDIDLGNIITPEQVQPDIAILKLNRGVDKYTGIGIVLPDNSQLKIDMDFDVLG